MTRHLSGSLLLNMLIFQSWTWSLFVYFTFIFKGWTWSLFVYFIVIFQGWTWSSRSCSWRYSDKISSTRLRRTVRRVTSTWWSPSSRGSAPPRRTKPTPSTSPCPSPSSTTTKNTRYVVTTTLSLLWWQFYVLRWFPFVNCGNVRVYLMVKWYYGLISLPEVTSVRSRNSKGWRRGQPIIWPDFPEYCM